MTRDPPNGLGGTNGVRPEMQVETRIYDCAMCGLKNTDPKCRHMFTANGVSICNECVMAAVEAVLGTKHDS